MNRTVLISGASKGIGRALAERLATQGHKVIGIARTGDATFPVNAAWGTRSRAILSHAETGTTSSFSNYAMVTGHGRQSDRWASTINSGWPPESMGAQTLAPLVTSWRCSQTTSPPTPRLRCLVLWSA